MPVVGVDDFKGIENRVAESKLPPGAAAESVNADRSLKGAWRPRRGLGRLDGFSAISGQRLLSVGWAATKSGNVWYVANRSTSGLYVEYANRMAAAPAPTWLEPPGRAGYLEAPNLSLGSVVSLVVTLTLTHNNDYGRTFNIWRDGKLVASEQGDVDGDSYADTVPAAGTYLYQVATVAQNGVVGEKASLRVVVA